MSKVKPIKHTKPLQTKPQGNLNTRVYAVR